MSSSYISHRPQNASNHHASKKSQTLNDNMKIQHSRSVSIKPRMKQSASCTPKSPTLKNKYSVHHEDKLKVYVKFKPPTRNHANNVSYINQKQVEIQKQTNNRIYSFDYVFHHDCDSQEVMNVGCRDMIDEVMDEGKNGLIFVYGHTGTGKTYTMGLLNSINQTSKGIVPEAIRYLFSKKLQNITLSFKEVYMDEVYDLLDFEGEKKLTIRQDKKTKEPYVQNLINISLNTATQAYQLINIGLQKRKIAEQKINKRSSRGHGIITLHIQHRNKSTKLCFVDLAGSERIKQSDSNGLTLNEAVHINSSLSALETLLMNINQKSYRMYRGNKLTRLLQPFMESGKVRLFVTSNYENIQPIEFGKRCKGIKFMERQVTQPVTPRKHMNASQQKRTNNNQEIESLLVQNKNLTYCVSNLIGIVYKINQFVSQILDSQRIHSNFSFSESLSIKNQMLEAKTNSKINKMQAMQEQIISKQSQNLFSTTPQEILTLIKEPTQFLKKVHQIGFEIFNSVKQLSNLTEFRNSYKKQVFVSDLKTNILENKNSQLENAINHLLKNQPNHAQNKIKKQLKEIGIIIQKGNATQRLRSQIEGFCNKNYQTTKPSKNNLNLRTNDNLDKSQFSAISKLTTEQEISQSLQCGGKIGNKSSVHKKTSRVGTENSPLNRSQQYTPVSKGHHRSLILIEDMLQ